MRCVRPFPSLRGVRASIAVLLVAGAAACSHIVGMDEYGVRPTAASEHMSKCDATSYRSETCRDCIDRACCREASSCSQDPACEDLVQCVARCDPNDHACRG